MLKNDSRVCSCKSNLSPWEMSLPEKCKCFVCVEKNLPFSSFVRFLLLQLQSDVKLSSLKAVVFNPGVQDPPVLHVLDVCLLSHT